MRMLKQSQNMQNEERKNLKVSTTIEDLRNVLEKQIEEKNKVIRVYENLIHKLKQKLKEKYWSPFYKLIFLRASSSNLFICN